MEQALGKFSSADVDLVPASTKGGYDEIYYARQNGKRFAVVRINSPYKKQNDPIGPLDPSIPLTPAERLNREWNAYNKLAPLGISPEPLWRTDNAIACTWLNWIRASTWLTRNRSDFWTVISQILPTVARMHHADVTHLDLNLGNLLLDTKGSGVAVIDFEFGPVEWVDTSQQQAFDFLRLIDDCIKPRRGGKKMLSNIPCLIKILDDTVSRTARDASLDFVYGKLQRLQGEKELCAALRKIFRNLP